MKKINRRLAQQIVDTVKDICGYHINFINEKGIILASTDENRIGDYHEMGFQAATQGTVMTVTSDAEFSGTRQGVNLPIFYNGAIAAVVGISGEADEVSKYAHLAERITRLLIREQELNEYHYTQREKRQYIVQSFIHGECLNDSYFKDCLAEFTVSTEKQMRVLIIQMQVHDHTTNSSMTERQITDLFQRTGINLFSYQYPNEYIALVEEPLFLQSHLLIARFADKYRNLVKIGIGRSVELLQLSGSYENAVAALKSLGSGKENLAVFDEIDLEMILNTVDMKTQKEYSQKVMRHLSEEDQSVLKVYYEENMSLLRTSQRLFVHKNTLQHRMNKIHQQSGYNPRLFKDAMVLYLGLCLQERVMI